MALFSSGSRSVKLYFKGDSSQLDRTLSKTEYKLKRFERVAGKSGLNSGLVGSFAKGGGALAAAGLFAVGLRKMARAAGEAEVVMGQTGVAVRQAGIDWAQAASVVEAGANKISKASSFDDEDVLKSFQVFVRGQKDVGKALDLSALAADVARGRYTDLESATQLVNKAAMGQVGALRRAGIQIDKNATSTQALAVLQKTYAGAAEQYSKSSIGAADRLRVSWENLLETLGQDTSNQVGQTQNALAGVVDWLNKIATKNKEVQQSWQDMIGGMTSTQADIEGLAKTFNNAFGLGALTAGRGGATTTPSFGQPGFKPGKQGIPATQVSNRLVTQELDARMSGNKSVLKGILAKEAQFLRDALRDPRITIGQEVGLKQALLGVTDEIAAMDAEMIQSAKDKAAAARSAKEKLREANRRAVEAFKDQANAIKSAVLNAFDTKQSKISNARALEDAQSVLKQARMLGGPETIKLALRDVNDAKAAIQRQKIEQMAFRVTEGPKGPVNTLAAGNIVININGATDPDKIAKQVIAAINRSKKQTAGQPRGRNPGSVY